MDCSRTLSIDDIEGGMITIMFIWFEVEDDSYCDWDFVEVSQIEW